MLARWGSQHAMMLRMIRLHKPLQAYFNNHFSSRALHATEWRSIRQFASILDPAAIVIAQIQGGRHGFIGKAINDFTCLFSSMVDDTQEIRDLDDPHNDPRTDVSKNTLNTEVQRALEVMTQDRVRGIWARQSSTSKRSTSSWTIASKAAALVCA